MQILKIIVLIVMGVLFTSCSGGGSGTPTEVISVINTAPVAIAKSITLNENQTQSVVLSGTDAEGNRLIYKVVLSPKHGVFKDGLYTPTAKYVGKDSFSFIANDGKSDSKSAIISITITADFDGDNVSNALDQDDDNDGVLDIFDPFPFDTTESLDTDQDGIGNSIDSDDDNDGVPDINDAFPLDVTESIDTDNDRIGNNHDLDDDGDGVSDLEELRLGTDPLDATSIPPNMIPLVTISGKITYDLVLINTNINALDYSNIVSESVKNIQIEAVSKTNEILATTRTDATGIYAITVPSKTDMKIRVSAKMINDKNLNWDVKVIDNTSSALYVMEGSLHNSGKGDSKRNLHASSGWDGNAYTTTRTAAPFAILDTIYHSMQKVLSADLDTVFEPLVVNWSVENKSLNPIAYVDGHISTSHYIDGNLYILGDKDADTDEYDTHVIAHEWAHYYEAKFSRSDSIGGTHGSADSLDIRVAFGEGWGNAFSGMALNDPLYIDTSGFNQASGFSINVETATHLNAGWFSEASIQRILYDIYDGDSDSNGKDTLSLGFTPIHKVFVGAEKHASAFTSIFTFIKALKDANLDEVVAIDALVQSENIATITDILGTGRTNKASAYPYMTLTVGNALSVQFNTEYGKPNKLNNHKYVKFTVVSSGLYSIKVLQVNEKTSDPDFVLYRRTPFDYLGVSASENAGLEEREVTLEEGDYLLDISDWNNLSTVKLDVIVRKN